MSADSLGGDVNDPQTLNRYSYVLNNPLTLIDPTGMLEINQLPPPGDDCDSNPTLNGCPYGPDLPTSDPCIYPGSCNFGPGPGPTGGGGHLPTPPKKNPKLKCPKKGRQLLNALILANTFPVQVAEGVALAQLTGYTVQIGVEAAGSFETGDTTPAAGGQVSLSLAFDPTGNIALAVNYGGGGGFGEGGIAGGTLAFSRTNSVFDLEGPSANFGGSLAPEGAGLGGGIELSTNAGGTITLTGGAAAGGVGTLGSITTTVIFPLICK
jgi:hypothetical protein